MRAPALFLPALLVLAAWPALGRAQDAPAASASGFAGTWETDYGRLVLEAKGGHLVGSYPTGTIEGEVSGRKLTFRYREAQTKGEGWFELDASGASFRGAWRAAGDTDWQPWSGRRVAPLGPFEGLFETDHGRLRLRRRGAEVLGTYLYDGSLGSLQGTVHAGRLSYAWKEGDSAGEGWFEVGGQPGSLSGKWCSGPAASAAEWSAWTASGRVTPRPGVRWLTVLEAQWETSLAEQEYSFGAMLRAYFRRYPQVQVRQRRFEDEGGLLREVREVGLLAEPTVLVIASHGSQGALTAGRGAIPAADLGQALAGCPNVTLLHFSACEVMQGQGPEQLEGELPRRLPLSGYAVTVDWSASAVLEFLYFDLVLGRGLPPEQAAQVVTKELRFAGDRPTDGSPLGAASFRFLK